MEIIIGIANPYGTSGAPVTKCALGYHTLSIDLLRPFPNHPFGVHDDKEMEVLINSIRAEGVITPVIARLTDDGQYEIISGHRRVYACKKLGISTVTVKVICCSDEDALCEMIASNVHRKVIRPSEMAKTVSLTHSMFKQQYGSEKGTDADTIYKYVSDKTALKTTQIKRYLRIATLHDDLLDRLDRHQISLVSAYELSFIDPHNQSMLCEALDEHSVQIDIKLAELLRKKSKKCLTPNEYIKLLDRKNFPRKKAPSEKLPKELLGFLPKTVSENNFLEYIIDAVKAYPTTEAYQSHRYE